MDVYFYEAFEEETEALRRHLPSGINANFTWKTVQESADSEPPARIVSIRTQSLIPTGWANLAGGILSRSRRSLGISHSGINSIWGRNRHGIHLID